MSTRMTLKQAESLERRWKATFFCFALMLMLDLVYLGVARPSGKADIACWLIAAALLYACVYAVRALHRAGYTEEKSINLDEPFRLPWTVPVDRSDFFDCDD